MFAVRISDGEIIEAEDGEEYLLLDKDVPVFTEDDFSIEEETEEAEEAAS